MRVTIVKRDSIVCVDGTCLNNIDTSDMPGEVRAVQWFGAFGEVEVVDPVSGRPGNLRIESITPYQIWIDRWQVKKDEIDNYQAASLSSITNPGDLPPAVR